MKFTKKLTKLPLISFVSIALLTAITYVAITTYGFKFDSSLTNTTRAEIIGEAEAINEVVSKIYKEVDVINTEIGGEDGGKQIQRVYYIGSEENNNKIKDILKEKADLTLSISQVNAGLKSDISFEIMNFLVVLYVIIIAVNIFLFKNVFDLKYSIIYSLLNIFTLLINIIFFLLVLSLLSKYGWHITNFTFNIFIGFVVSLTAGIVFLSLLFKRSMGELENISAAGEHFKTFFESGYRAYFTVLLILISSLIPLLYFYSFRVEALIVLALTLFSALFIKVVYTAVLNWYDQIRLAEKKYNKKKK
ncbi:hypothetical protein KBD45_02410 [Candidatus Dojkabacteria bacterium]|nr:hypothetical protein [Candidatus Dojkabacteria bacterium]